MTSYIDISYETLPQPKQLRLDTTTKCNARCLSCHRFLTKRSGEMSMELLSKILKDVARWETPLEEIVPVNYGEFLCRKDWLWILRVIADKLPATRIVLPTNGSMLNEEAVKNLASIPTLKIINFSINAFLDETYESFTGFNPAIKLKIETSIYMFKVLRPDIEAWVSMVFNPQYQSDLEHDFFIQYWMKRKVTPWVLTATQCNRGDTDFAIPRREPCRSIYSDIVVGYDGKLSSCCFDAGFTLDLGEYTGNLREDWHNEKLTELRRLHTNFKRQEIELCKKCSYA